MHRACCHQVRPRRRAVVRSVSAVSCREVFPSIRSCCPVWPAAEGRVGADSPLGLSHSARLAGGIRKSLPPDCFPPQGRCSAQRIDRTGGVILPGDGLDLPGDHPVQEPFAFEAAEQLFAQGPEKQAVARREFLAERLRLQLTPCVAPHRCRPLHRRAARG